MPSTSGGNKHKIVITRGKIEWNGAAQDVPAAFKMVDIAIDGKNLNSSLGKGSISIGTGQMLG